MKLGDFYDSLDNAVPYLNRETMQEMYEGGTVFSVTAVNERVGSFKGKPREEWVVTIEYKDEDGNSVKGLCTFVKSANRDNFMQAISEKLPVTDVKFSRRGQAKSWVFVPADYVEDGESEGEAADEETPATSKRRGGRK